MNKGSKYILIGLSIFLIIITIIVMIISSNNPNNNNKISNNSNNNIIKENVVERLDDERTFFNIQYNIQNNLDSPLDSYKAQKIYTKRVKNINYYFIEGYLLTGQLDIHEISSLKYQNYIMISNNNKYALLKVDNNNIEEYAKSYRNDDIELTKEFKTINISTADKIGGYLGEFTNMLIVYPPYSYNILGDNAKLKYSDYNDFYSNRIELKKIVKTRVMRYNETENNSKKLYKVVTYDLKEYQIIEYYPNDFKIDF